MVKSRPTVQGSARLIKVITGVGNWKKDTPKSPVDSLTQKSLYCCSQGPRQAVHFRQGIHHLLDVGWVRYVPRERISAMVLSTGLVGAMRG